MKTTARLTTLGTCILAIIGGLLLWCMRREGTEAISVEHVEGLRAVKVRMLRAAKEAYHTSAIAFENRLLPFSEVYRWSRRWAESLGALAETREARLTAIREHLDRMKWHHARIEKWRELSDGRGDGETLLSAEYYVAEAELWVLRARGYDDSTISDKNAAEIDR